MSIPLSIIAERLECFCKYYKVPKRHHGSLEMLAEMAFIFDLELEPQFVSKPTHELPLKQEHHNG